MTSFVSLGGRNQHASSLLALFALAEDGVMSGQENRTQQEQEEEGPPPSLLRELYPPSEAHENGTLQVDTIHTLYYEVHGGGGGKQDKSTTKYEKTSGKSALFWHGGPGAGCTPTHARFFDSNQCDTIVLVDQRGCGRSAPRGQIYNNALALLVEDFERLRQHILGDEDTAWDVVLGGSWGFDPGHCLCTRISKSNQVSDIARRVLASTRRSGLVVYASGRCRQKYSKSLAILCRERRPSSRSRKACAGD